MSARESLRNLRWSAIGACVVLIVFVAVYSWLSWREIKQRELRQMTSLVELAGNSLETYFSALEGAFLTVGETMLDSERRVDAGRATAALHLLKKGHPDLRLALVTNIEGEILAITEPRRPGAPTTLAGQSWFTATNQALRRQPGFGIGRPFVGPVTGEWVIPVRYSVPEPSGESRHVVSAGLPIAKPQSLWKEAPLPAGAALGLISDEGYMVARYPVPPKADLRELFSKPRTGPAMAAIRDHTAGHGVFQFHSTITDEDTLLVFRRLSRLPVTMYATNPMANVHKAWLESVGVLYLLAVVSMVGLAVIYSWTRRRQLAWDAEREERMRDLEHANRELESFNYTVSHDLRAPLRAISAFSALLADKHGQRLDSEARQLLARVTTAAQRMNAQVEHLLSLARIHRQQLERKDVDISLTAQEVVSELKAADPSRDVDVSIAPGLVARADPGLLRAVLQNLISNAWKFTGKRDNARVEVGAETRDGDTAYFVRDNGAGFDMQYADKLFCVFERLHADPEFPGTGIGLAIVERIVKRHGGRVWAEGAPGEGACVYFTLGPA